ncbi:MAG: MBL fold metallo-hydrolase [Lachnospiraceae bacterium]|nr:MBL fold metallo-hydrolase [Lachnospiraceae bacterium]
MTDYDIMHFVVGPVMTNCYTIINKDTMECLVIDPGASGAALYGKIKEAGATVKAILATHAHFDHMGGVDDLIKASGYDIPIYIHEAEKASLTDPDLNQAGMIGQYNAKYHADIFLRDDEIIELAGFKIKVLFTPGHTPGGCCYYFENEGIVFCGDTLFNGSVGRTDFPGGSMSTLVRAIQEKLYTLPDETQVYPGHNEPTTIGYEKTYNMFVNA